GPADAQRAAGCGKAVVTADRRDEKREDDRFGEPDDQILQLQVVDRGMPVEGLVDVKPEIRNEHPPDDSDQIGDQRERKKHDQDRLSSYEVHLFHRVAPVPPDGTEGPEVLIQEDRVLLEAQERPLEARQGRYVTREARHDQTVLSSSSAARISSA